MSSFIPDINNSIGIHSEDNSRFVYTSLCWSKFLSHTLTCYLRMISMTGCVRFFCLRDFYDLRTPSTWLHIISIFLSKNVSNFLFCVLCTRSIFFYWISVLSSDVLLTSHEQKVIKKLVGISRRHFRYAVCPIVLPNCDDGNVNFFPLQTVRGTSTAP